MTGREFRLTLPATAENVMVVRQAVAGLGEALGLSRERIADLKTVVTEACNNVVLHAYEDEAGPLEVIAVPGDGKLDLEIADEGRGFRPRARETEPSLGLGLPLIAALSDSFQISGGLGRGSRTTICFGFAPPMQAANGTPAEPATEVAMAITPGDIVRPILARVMGAVAARAQFSVDRLADTVLLGDAVSTSRAGDFADGRVAITIEDGNGTLDVRVGPLVEGAGQRLMAEMELPGHGSLKSLTRRMDVTSESTAEGGTREFLVFEVGP